MDNAKAGAVPADKPAPTTGAAAPRRLSAADLLAARPPRYKDVYVRGMDGLVRVKALTAKERDAFEASLTAVKKNRTLPNLQNVRARLLALALVNEDMSRMFDSPAQIDQLGDQYASDLDQLFKVAQELSGVSDDDVEELLGNSNGTAGAGSSSGLR